MPSFEKAHEVDEDLRDIVCYTASMWGAAQVRRYMAGLEQRMEALAIGAAHSRAFADLHEHLRITKYQRHYIFGITREGRPMLILAIFHERMQMLERVSKRLAQTDGV